MKRVLVVLLLFLCGCSGALKQSRPLVVVPVPPYASFVTAIAGSSVDVMTISPPNADPHYYEPTPQQAQELSRATLWISLGENFERPILRSIESKRSDLTILALAQNNEDPHLWLSPPIAAAQVKRITAELVSLFPDHADLYHHNADILLKQLTQLDEDLKKILEKARGQAILVSHPSYSYFCKEYGLIQIAIEVEGKSPRPQDLSRALSEAREHTVRCALEQPQFNNTGVEKIAKLLELKIYMVDPLAWNYMDEMRHLAEVIAK